MLSKTKSGDQQSKSRGGLKKKFKLFSKMTRTAPVSSYVRMESDGKKNKKTKVGDAEAKCKDKENNVSFANKEVKDKKKKRSWKRIRQVALTTCRYIGMGAVHMNPAAAYATPDYYVDPKTWNKSFSPSYKPKVHPQTPHWTSTMMFSGW